MILNYFPDRVLIVGGTGFTGERAALRMRRLGVNVRVLTREADSPVVQRLKQNGCEIFKGDCIRRWTLWEALEGCDVVVSCAHIRYAEVLVQGCMRGDVHRLVCVSSTRRFSRVDCPTVGDVLAGEAAIVDSDLDWTILRPTMIYGGERDRNISRIIKQVRHRPWIPMFGNGSSRLQPVLVEDVVTSIVETLRRPQTVRKDYTLSGAENMSYDELLKEVFRVMDREIRIVHIPVPVALAALKFVGPIANKYGFTEREILRLQEDKAFDHEAATHELGFVPTPFREAVGMMVARTSEVDVLYAPVS